MTLVSDKYSIIDALFLTLWLSCNYFEGNESYVEGKRVEDYLLKRFYYEFQVLKER
jgi:hypothetical protein